MYEGILASALRLCGVGSVLEVKRMTLEEFDVRKRGYPMQHLERGRGIHLQAYLNRLIKATDKNSKNHLYGNFNDSYNKARARSTVPGNGYGEPVSGGLIAIAKRRQELLRKGDNND